MGPDDRHSRSAPRLSEAIAALGVATCLVVLGLTLYMSPDQVVQQLVADVRPQRHEVSGRVFWRGKPIEAGVAQFIPQVMARCGDANFGPISVAIVSGQFRLEEGQGLPSGLYHLRIHTPEGELTDLAGPLDAPPALFALEGRLFIRVSGRLPNVVVLDLRPMTPREVIG